MRGEAKRVGAAGRLGALLLLTAAAALLPVGREAGMAADEPLRVAYAEAEITPPLGGSMPGYFQDRQAAGVLDPLKAKVLVLRKGETSAAIVSCDLIGIGAPLVRRIREAVRERVRPAPDQVWVHATHTHTGGMVPRTDAFTSDAEEIYPGFYPGRVDGAWIDSLVERTAAAVGRAVDSLAPERRVSLHEGRNDRVAFYRRFLMKDGRVRTNPGRNNPQVVRPAGEIDPRLHVLRFEENRILTVIYGLHPDCVGGNHYSADYPHHLAEALRRDLGAGWRVLFLNAACGNINHIDVSNPAQRSGPAEAERIGRSLAVTALEALRGGAPLEVDRLALRRARVVSRLRRPAPEEVAEAERRLRTGENPFEFNGLFAPAAVVLARTRDREHPAEIAALRLGSFALAAMPGEIFVELAREVEAASPFRPARTIGLTNGSMGYIPTREGYRQGGYEAGYRSARYEPENGHRWAAAAARLLREMER